MHPSERVQAWIFWGGAHPLEMICTPPPKAFCTHANYIYFDLIVSYLIILTTKFVKLPILWSQISPCRPRKQILLNFFLDLSGRCPHAPAKASSSTHPLPPRYLSTPLNENMKIRLWKGYMLQVKMSITYSCT